MTNFHSYINKECVRIHASKSRKLHLYCGSIEHRRCNDLLHQLASIQSSTSVPKPILLGVTILMGDSLILCIYNDFTRYFPL